MANTGDVKKALIPFLSLVLCISAWSQESARSGDCSTLKYLRHRTSCLCGKVTVCSGDICGRPSFLDFDDNLDVVLRDKHGNVLESKKLAYTSQQPNFCFQERQNGDYQLAFVLYKKGAPQPARVFPTKYKRNTTKPCDSIYMLQAVCPKLWDSR